MLPKNLNSLSSSTYFEACDINKEIRNAEDNAERALINIIRKETYEAKKKKSKKKKE